MFKVVQARYWGCSYAQGSGVGREWIRMPASVAWMEYAHPAARAHGFLLKRDVTRRGADATGRKIHSTLHRHVCYYFEKMLANFCKYSGFL